MQHVLTLVSDPARFPLDPMLVARVAAAVEGTRTEILADAEAADIFVATPPDPGKLAAALAQAPVDAIVTPAEGRRKRLLVADMDSTIVTSETLDELAAHAGLGERVAAITRRSMNGEIDFAAALRERVAMLRGLPLAALDATWARTVLTPGAAELVRTMRAHGARTALVSGGFTWFTARVAALCGFDTHHANVLLDDGAALTGGLGEPILDRAAKLVTLRALAAEAGLGLGETLAVGDGANDLAMLGEAGLGVAFRAKPVVAAAARAKVEFSGLRALLFAQGFRAREIVA
jgi:phosphoserine phosphatase